MKYLYNFLLINIVMFSCKTFSAGVNGDANISDTVGVSVLTISTCDKDAGSICRMSWKGKQLVDDYDHGRQIQTAVTYDGLGEGYNPTEAGSKFNGTSSNSSSFLNSISVTQDQLETESVLAFWLRPGECSVAGQGACAVNQTIRSKTIVDKTVKIGFENMPHVVEMLVSVTLEPESSNNLINFDRATFKIMSGHFSGKLNNFYIYNKDTKQLESVTPNYNTNTAYNAPVVIANSDGSIAIAYYTPDQSSGVYNHNYNMSYFTNVNTSIPNTNNMVKLVDVYRINNPVPGSTHHFRTYMAISSKQNITTALEHLHNFFE